MGESSKRILRMNFLVLLTACAAAASALDVQKILTPKNEVAALSCKNGKANLAKDTEVTIETPNYPENYPDRAKCNWKIRVPGKEDLQKFSAPMLKVGVKQSRPQTREET